MTTHVETSYLETPYLQNPYLVNNVNAYDGHQAKFVINANKHVGMQCFIQIVNRPIAQGEQAKFTIANPLVPAGQQAQFVIGGSKTLGQQASFSPIISGYEGMQADLVVASSPAMGHQAKFTIEKAMAFGEQSKFNINNFPRALGHQARITIGPVSLYYGMQYKQDNIAHEDCNGYLEAAYLADPYLTHEICAHAAMQAKFVVSHPSAYGGQAQFNIVDHLQAYGHQAQFVIANHAVTVGMQADFIQQLAIGMQARIVLYNTDHLRMLCDFPSRGLSTSTGTNGLGNPSGKGKNWRASSTETGDFSPFNLNTDIVEQVWRSNGVISGITLDCDTERPQGVFVDTFAMLNHNLTSSANVIMQGANVSNFSVIGVTIPLEVLKDDTNMYWISPALPLAGFRYWRVSIDDSSNPDGYIEVGTIIFGAASIFFGECFVDQVEFQLKDYTDSVQTEGFTNVNNSRSQKKVLRLDFRSLAYLKSNFKLLRQMFKRERTVLKCLWLPTPDPDNQEYTARFAVFSKLAQIPTETHNHKGGDADYVTFNIELDESK